MKSPVCRPMRLTGSCPSPPHAALGRAPHCYGGAAALTGSPAQPAPDVVFLDLGCAESPREFAPPLDVELPVRAREGLLDCLRGHEQLVTDLTVGVAPSRPARDPQFARRECLDSGHAGAPWPPSGGHELLARAFCHWDRAAAVSQVQRLPQRLARLCALARSTHGSSEL